jgi:hypothetical protein
MKVCTKKNLFLSNITLFEVSKAPILCSRGTFTVQERYFTEEGAFRKYLLLQSSVAFVVFLLVIINIVNSFVSTNGSIIRSFKILSNSIFSVVLQKEKNKKTKRIFLFIFRPFLFLLVFLVLTEETKLYL